MDKELVRRVFSLKIVGKLQVFFLLWYLQAFFKIILYMNTFALNEDHNYVLRANIFNNNMKGNVYGQVLSQKILQVTTREGVSLTISYHPYFLRISKIQSMLYNGSVVSVHSEECCFCLLILFWHCFVLFHQEKYVMSFSFPFFFMKYQISATTY